VLDRLHPTDLRALGGELRADGDHRPVEFAEVRLGQPHRAKPCGFALEQKPEGPDLVELLLVDRRKHQAAVGLDEEHSFGA